MFVGDLNRALFCIDFQWSSIGIFTLEAVDFAVDPQMGLTTKVMCHNGSFEINNDPYEISKSLSPRMNVALAFPSNTNPMLVALKNR